MAAPFPDFTTYTFGTSATFNRLITGEIPAWFGRKAEFTEDLVLDSSASYLDIGATAWEQLSFRALFGAEGDRADMESKVGETAELANSRSRVDQATLIAAQPIDLGIPGLYFLDVTFVRRPSP